MYTYNEQSILLVNRFTIQGPWVRTLVKIGYPDIVKNASIEDHDQKKILISVAVTQAQDPISTDNGEYLQSQKT